MVKEEIKRREPSRTRFSLAKFNDLIDILHLTNENHLTDECRAFITKKKSEKSSNYYKHWLTKH